MKKGLVFVFAALLVAMFSVPAMAVDNIFGGYWRTRAFMQRDFSGIDTETQDLQRVDTRTRLYYTAKFSDNFKFVNKFEMDAVWGDNDETSGYGDIGADGVRVEVKNSYADFTLGAVNLKIGVQGYTYARGFLFDDDGAGAVVTYKADGFSLPFIWIKENEGGKGKDKNDQDVDIYGIAPKFTVGGATVNPYFFWNTSKSWDGADHDWDVWYLGVDADFDLDVASVWLTAIYEGGEVEDAVGTIDVGAFLFALGASADVGAADVHGQIFYATGDDNDADDDAEAFFGLAGQSYYWAEIMGLGIFDNQASNNSCEDAISDIMAANIGATFKPADKLSVTADLWYAKLAEDDANGEDYLGTEIDLKLTYAIMDNLKIDVVGAYLFAGDATTNKAANDANPYEIGTRLSLSF